MPYKPKFCCQCKEEIDRNEWQPWKGTRFCELCETNFGIYDKIPWILAGICLVFGILGIGLNLQKPAKQLDIAQSQLIASSIKSEAIQQPATLQISSDKVGQSPTLASNSTSSTAPKVQTTQLLSNLKGKQFETQRIESPEKVYFCGAQTKKGTMCSRRVRNGGRCWQHEGQPAMLPQEKLLIVQ